MAEPESLRDEAERCFRLARAIGAQDVMLKLLELGGQYAERAENIETAPRASEGKGKTSNREIAGIGHLRTTIF